jgi:biotin synthase
MPRSVISIYNRARGEHFHSAGLHQAGLMPMTDTVRHDWTREEIRAIYNSPLLDLVFRAATVYRAHHNPREMQVCKLISIKTGACPEDCSYCAQSSRYETDITPQALLKKESVMEIAARAKASGVSRVCMGAAWREVRDGVQFDRVLDRCSP